MRETVAAAAPLNTPRQVLFASLIGTTIEFFDFYIYATAAVLVFPTLFFPASDPASATLASLATFAIAFVAAIEDEGQVVGRVAVVVPTAGIAQVIADTYGGNRHYDFALVDVVSGSVLSSSQDRVDGSAPITRLK